jgi:DNA-binding PadR family transcriptional regulator
MVLRALLHAEPGTPMWGYQIREQAGLAGGTIYGILGRLATAELVQARWEAPDESGPLGRPPRRLYELTPEGRELAGRVALPTTGGKAP